MAWHYTTLHEKTEVGFLENKKTFLISSLEENKNIKRHFRI